MKIALNTIKLLRFPFSIFLLPVSLFSFVFIQPLADVRLLLVLFIWHLLVFPASNGYNSYHDRDTGPVGGLATPPLPTKNLLHVVNAMDLSAILLSTLVNYFFALFVVVYIIASRLYSNRSVRLKKYPLTSFIIVFIFQGAWIFYANLFAFNKTSSLGTEELYAAISSSLFIGSIYPITQIYQHDSDKKDGVTTLSMLLGTTGTFLFSAAMFTLANLFVFLAFNSPARVSAFILFVLFMLPTVAFFIYWSVRSIKNKQNVNFKNTMTLLVLSSLSNNTCFLLLIFI